MFNKRKIQALSQEVNSLNYQIIDLKREMNNERGYRRDEQRHLTNVINAQSKQIDELTERLDLLMNAVGAKLVEIPARKTVFIATSTNLTH